MTVTTEGSEQSPPASKGAPTTVLLGFTLTQAICVLAWPALLLSGLYASVLVKDKDLVVLEQAIRARPAVKVVNVTEVMRAQMARGLTADQAVAAADAAFQEYGKAGYLVIDQNAVLALPPGMEINK